MLSLALASKINIVGDRYWFKCAFIIIRFVSSGGIIFSIRLITKTVIIKPFFLVLSEYFSFGSLLRTRPQLRTKNDDFSWSFKFFWHHRHHRDDEILQKNDVERRKKEE